MNKILRSIIPASFILCIIASVITSCIEEYNAMLPSSESDVLVVEGTIISDSVSTFYLSLTMPINNDKTFKDVDNATIELRGSDGLVVKGFHASAGTYKIDTPKLDKNVSYKVVITYNGETYETEEQTPFPSLPIKNVEFNQKSPNAAVDILITTEVPDDPSEIQYFRWTYNETWEVHPEYVCRWTWDNQNDTAVYDFGGYPYPRRGWMSASGKEILASSTAYYHNNQIVQFKLYDVSNKDKRLFVEYSTDIVQRSLRKAEYEYETERKRISTEMGGLFTPQPSSLPTNIHCITSSKHVLGYVGCALNVSHYRIFIFQDQVNVVQETHCDEQVTTGKSRYKEEHVMYNNGYLLYNYLQIGAKEETFYWAKPQCVDVREQGCKTNMPSFWIDRFIE